MKLEVTTLDGDKAGEVELDDAVFGLEPRADILHALVRWQLAKRQAGTHKTKDARRNQSAPPKKIYSQKGTGSARHGAAARRNSAAAARPSVRSSRSHAHDLPKKVRSWR